MHKIAGTNKPALKLKIVPKFKAMNEMIQIVLNILSSKENSSVLPTNDLKSNFSFKRFIIYNLSVELG